MIMYTHIVTKQTFKQKYWYQLHRAHPLAEADMVKLTRDKWVQIINIELNGTDTHWDKTAKKHSSQVIFSLFGTPQMCAVEEILVINAIRAKWMTIWSQYRTMWSSSLRSPQGLSGLIKS